MADSGFVHLHLHTEYSLLDGAIRLKDLANRIEELGMHSCAITDHGNMFGAVEFYKTMTAKGIHPIIGCEVYVAPGSRYDTAVENVNKAYNHLILLAKDNTGLQNLNRLVSAGYLEGFYRKPRIDKELLVRWHEGLICLSACIAGKVPSLITDGLLEEAEKEALWFDSLFGRGNYYLEIQSNVMPEQAVVNAALVKMSRKTGIPLVATNDCHYLRREDAEVQDVLMCMQMGTKLNDAGRMKFSTDDFYVKSEAEMRRFFSEIPEAIDNTVKIAQMCQAEFDFKTIHLPEFDIPQGFKDNKEYLNHLTYEGLKKRLEIKGKYASDEEYLERVNYELSVINNMGYTDYYLIVWDFIRYAKSNGVLVGPGRGSGAGSLVAYCIGITNIDPLRYSLVFERFLNAERVSMPDFDVDFATERRQDVIDYVTRKYGQERVAQVVTFGTLAARLCIRDVARVMDLNPTAADKVAKMIPQDKDITIEKALEINPELKAEYEGSDEVKKVMDYAMKLEGIARHTSTHAAGVIISGKPITDIAPLAVNDGNAVVQYEKVSIESIGLLKFDFLGLRTLSVIQNTVDLVKEIHGITLNLDDLSFDDKAVFDMIGRGDTIGVFQLESRGMTNFMKDLKPNSLEDIIAGISLYRPGPMDQIPRYIESKNNPSKIKYDHPLLEPILNVTYGCMVYQEQAMQIVRDLSGFSMGQSDNIRRAMSKKKKSLMEAYRELFINGGVDENGKKVIGAVNNGVPADIADKIFNDVSNFAGYAFNKSHAAVYSVVAYFTAYLKLYYPVEFMSSMLNSFRTNLGAASWYITCCEKMGINVLPPDVNKSVAVFYPENGAVRIGLTVLKNVGEAAVNTLIEERNRNGEFKSFEDFLVRCSQIGIKRNMIESLIYSSALDSFGVNRATMISTVQIELDKLNSANSRQMEGQLSLFDIGGEEAISEPSIRLVETNEYSTEERLNLEKEYAGVYLSGHPLNDYKECISRLVTFDVLELKEHQDAETVSVLDDDKPTIMCAIALSKKVRFTKTKTPMATITAEDLFGQYEAVLFGKTYENYGFMLENNKPYIFVGKKRVRNDSDFSFSVDKVFPMPRNNEEYSRILEDKLVRFALSVSKRNISTKKNIDEDKSDSKTESVEIIFDMDSNDPKYNRLLNLLTFFNGELPVDIVFSKDNSRVRVDRSCYLSSNPDVLEIVAEYVGTDNIRFIKG